MNMNSREAAKNAKEIDREGSSFATSRLRVNGID